MADKRAAFEAYDFAGDDGWVAYLKRFEIPSNAAGAVRKLQAKYYKNHIDPDFDPSTVEPPTQAAPRPTSASDAAPRSRYATSSTSTQAAPAAGSTHATGAAGSGFASSANDLSVPVAFAMQLVAALVYLQPFHRGISLLAYRAFLQLTLLAYGTQLYRRFGLPGLNMASLRSWATQALPTTAFHFFSLALVFLGQPPVTVLLVPLVLAAAQQVDAFAAQRFSGHPLYARLQGPRAHQALVANQVAIASASAAAEVAMGVSMIVNLFTPARSMMATFFVWHTLKGRYISPDVGPYHKQVWAKLDAQTAGIRRSLPLLNAPIGYVQRWFLRR